MAKRLTKTELLSPDCVKSIQRLYNGNVYAFYEKHLVKLMDQNTFYCAMRLESITREVRDTVEAAIYEDLLLEGITEDTLSNIPDIETLIFVTYTRIKDNEEVASLINYFDFYVKMLQKKRIRFEVGKKTVLTTKMNYHYWSKFLTPPLLDKEYLENEAEFTRQALEKARFEDLYGALE